MYSVFIKTHYMKLKRYIFMILIAFLFSTASTSCRTAIFTKHSKTEVKTNAKGEIPPGQEKKLKGEKSAKKYAPGQEKK